MRTPSTGSRNLCFILVLAVCLIFAAFPGTTWQRPASAFVIGKPYIPPGTIGPHYSALAADWKGNVWVCGQDYIYRIAPSGDAAAFPVPPSGSPEASLVCGPDRNIWFTRDFPGRLCRITQDGIVTEFPLDMDTVGRVTVGTDGNLWFTADNLIGRMTPDGSLSRFPLPVASSSPVGITAGPDGNVWFVEVRANKIGRITPAGQITRFSVPTSVPLGTSQLLDITAGPDGNLWFTEYNRIGRITPQGMVTEFPFPDPADYASAITTGPDGTLWFPLRDKGAIGRITPAGVYLEELKPASDVIFPVAITASPDGLVWFTGDTGLGLAAPGTLASSFPLVSGNAWTYQAPGSSAWTQVVSPGVFNVNGINTKRLLASDGSEMYITNDANGVREHREYDPSPPATRADFQPPFVFAAYPGDIGVPVNSAGDLIVVQGAVQVSVPYGGQAIIEGFERIQTPAGPFRTARLRSTLEAYGIYVEQALWLADHVGIVRQVLEDEIGELVATNVANAIPDPFWFRPHFASDLNTLTDAYPFTVSGITVPAPIKVVNGAYQVNGGAFTSTAGTVRNGDTVTVRLLSADTPMTARTATLDIGGVAANFTVWTHPGPTLAPTARFRAGETAGIEWVHADFLDLSTGIVDTWSWDLGDGESSTNPNPFHSYWNPGTYTVALTVTGPYGSSTLTRPAYITVYDRDTVQGLIRQYYQAILDREADEYGVNTWTYEIDRTVRAGIDIKEGFIALAMNFFTCEEYGEAHKTEAEYVTDLYEAFLGRVPAQAEIDAWVSELGQGLRPGVLMAFFAYCDEFRNTMRGLFGSGERRPEPNLVNDFYRGLLGRLPDGMGFADWLWTMQNAQCTQGPEKVKEAAYAEARAFFESAEYDETSRSGEVFVENLYNAFLRRGADAAGFNYWVNQLVSGALTRSNMLTSFVESEEFQDRVEEVLNAGCVD